MLFIKKIIIIKPISLTFDCKKWRNYIYIYIVIKTVT